MVLKATNDCKVVEVTTPESSKWFRETWCRRWQEEGYAINGENIVEKYAKFNSYSSDFLLMNNNDLPIGTLRIIKGNTVVGLPVLNDFTIETQFLTEEKLCEATLLTIKKEERNSNRDLALLLLIELWRYARDNHFDGIVIAADIRLWHYLTKMLNLCFMQIGPEKFYEGSVTVPGYLSVEKQKQNSLKTSPKNILDEAMQQI